MDDRHRERLGSLLERALGIAADERPRFFDTECGADTELRGELESLVAAFESSSGYFEELAELVAPVLSITGEVDVDEPAIGRTVAHYEVLERAGSGGMGVVYKARDLRLGRLVALKFLPAQLTADDSARSRLLTEARAASALDHPNIGVVHEIGENGAGVLFIAMSWYDGETLKQLLQRGPLDVPQVLAIATQVAAALAAAHATGIIHRDVKPSNILITRNAVAKLVDFGIARIAGDEVREGATLGTVAYMSPEQTRGAAIDPRTDVWSVGVLIYEMVTGRRPFRGADEEAVIYGIRHDEPKPMSTLRPDIPAALVRIVDTCLAKDPAVRYERAEDLFVALQALAQASTGVERAASSRTGHGGSGDSRLHGLPRRPRVGRAVAAAALLAASGYYASTRFDGGLRAERVVVAQLENRTGDASLDPIGPMAADWVTQGLARTGVVDVVPVTAALTASRFVAGSVDSANTSQRIRLLGEETAAGIVVSGAYYQQRDTLYFRVTVSDVERDRVLYALDPIAAPSAAPLEAVEELRQRVMGVLASHLNPRMQADMSRPGIVPPTFNAYRAHAEGLELFIAGDFRAAIARFAEAAAHDSTFLAPLVPATIAFLRLGDLASVDSMLALARPHLHLLHTGDRLAFDFVDALLRGDRVAAYRAHLRYPQLAPGTLAHWGLANAALWVNRPRETVRVSRQLDPDRGELRGWFDYWRDLARAHHRLAEHREELRVARRARAAYPDESRAIVAEVRALAALRRHRDLGDLLSKELAAHPDPAWLLRQTGLELLAHGATAAGEARLRESRERHAAATSETVAHRVFLGDALLLVGGLAEAERVFRALAAERPDLWEVGARLGLIMARRGAAAEASAIADRLASLDRPYLAGRNTYWRARIAAQLGEPDRAVRLLRQAFHEGMDIWDAVHTEPDFAGLRSHPLFQELTRPQG